MDHQVPDMTLRAHPKGQRAASTMRRKARIRGGSCLVHNRSLCILASRQGLEVEYQAVTDE